MVMATTTTTNKRHTACAFGCMCVFVFLCTLCMNQCKPLAGKKKTHLVVGACIMLLWEYIGLWNANKNGEIPWNCYCLHIHLARRNTQFFIHTNKTFTHCYSDQFWFSVSVFVVNSSFEFWFFVAHIQFAFTRFAAPGPFIVSNTSANCVWCVSVWARAQRFICGRVCFLYILYFSFAFIGTGKFAKAWDKGVNRSNWIK